MALSERITRKDVHTFYLQALANSETVSWARFNSFVVLNAVLLGSWTAIWVSNSRAASGPILPMLSLVGVVAGIFWGALGYRGRKFQDAYVRWAGSLEDRFRSDIFRPATSSLRLRDKLEFGWAGSYWILMAVPGCLAVLHLAMVLVWSSWAVFGYFEFV